MCFDMIRSLEEEHISKIAYMYGLLEILVELQLVLVEYFVPLIRFSFELCGNAKRNTLNRMIIDVHKLTISDK